MTSYALLSFLEAGHVTSGLPIVKWLLSQQNDCGGFQSTQDTVVGLQALSKFAEKISSKDSNVRITIGYGDNAEANMNVNADNAIILQKYEVKVNLCDVLIYTFILFYLESFALYFNKIT